MEMKLEKKKKRKNTEGCRKNSVYKVWRLQWSLQWMKLSQVRRTLAIGMVWWYHMARTNSFTGIYQRSLSAQSTCLFCLSILSEKRNPLLLWLPEQACRRLAKISNWELIKLNVFSRTCGRRWEEEQLLVQTFLAWIGDFVKKTQQLLNTVSLTNTGKYQLIPPFGTKIAEV